ncbi:MAG TPA: benzoate-CoA ligase family protein [Myxococcaceae bacterium]|nr:benzoate-CoA ligase family protein [Myxococcaceae bacterium]
MHYNATADLIGRNLTTGRAGKVALIEDGGRRFTYGELAERIDRAGNALRSLGVQMEQRVLLLLHDTADLPALFWGAMKIGAVAVPVNTLLTTAEYDFFLRDSRARVLVVSRPLLEKVAPILRGQPFLSHTVISGGAADGYASLDALLADAAPSLDPAPTTADDVAFWLYSSGSTGAPKGAMHLHQSLVRTAELYGQGVLGIREDDVVYSAAKLFFAYGLGNAMTFPFSVGATVVLLVERPTPASVMRVMREHQTTLFYGVPTLFASLLADPQNGPSNGSARLRLCVSAGEPLPRDIGERWKARFGVDILDGLGSTEMLHIFLSNRPGDVRYGTTGRAVPGYELEIVDENDRPVPPGELGELKVSGPSSAIGYWNNRARSVRTFRGPWTFTGDKYREDERGDFVYCGRADDMLKVSGMWVSPAEVEAALVGHDSVLEVAVVGREDEHGLTKPQAFVVVRPGVTASPALVEELQRYVKDRLAPYKYPRWIEFLEALPNTATGKIQRFKLRGR